MSRKWWNLIKTTPLLVSASVLTAQGAVANPKVPETQINSFSLPSNEQLLAQAVPGTPGSPAPEATEILQMMQRSREGKRINTQVYDKPMSQVTNVNQLRDVEPTAWAYEALRSLVERYGCIVGYPDRTFRGDRALTRWEFAAGLNACLNVLERLIQEGIAVVREDLETLKRLADEFAAELAALGARVDNLESRVAFLEDHQFSTTTKLNGEVIFALANAWTDDFSIPDSAPRSQASQVAFESRPVGRQTVFTDRVRLNFDASFTGKDRLRVRLESGTTPNFARATGSNMSRLGFDIQTDNDMSVTDLYYRFSPFSNFTAWVGTTNMGLEDVFNPGNPYLEPSGTGALSRFIRRNPLVFRGPDGNGVGARYKFSDFITVTALYLADENDARSPLPGQGVFNGSFSTGVQAVVTPFDRFNINLTYLHSYFSEGSVNLSGSTGSAITGNPSAVASATRGIDVNSAWTRDSVGAQVDWQALDWLHFTLWGGYAYAETKNPDYDSSGDIWTWNAVVNFIDILKEGAVLSFSGGMPPRITGVENGPDDLDTSIILEAQYQYPLTDNILLTPGFFVVLDPNHYDRNDDIWVGVLRTTFKF